MPSKRRRPLRTKDGFNRDIDLRAHEVPCWSLPVPPEQRAEQPFVYDPVRRAVIAPWPRGPVLSMADERRLFAVFDRLAALDPPPRQIVWVWPHRDPVPIEEASQI
jgi:hypothetical protein